MGALPATLRNRPLLAAILVLAAFVRLGYVFSLDNDRSPDNSIFSDGGADIAKNLVEGKGYITYHLDRPFLSFRPPLYPYFLAVQWHITGISALGARIAQAFLGVIVVLLVYLLGHQLAGDQAGLAAAALSAIYPPLIYWAGLLGPQSLTVVLVCGSVLVAWKLNVCPSMATAAACGVLLGLVSLNRSMFLGLSGVSILWLLTYIRPHRRSLALSTVLAAAFILTCSPWIVRNHLVHGHWVLASTEGGLTFFMANNPIVLESLKSDPIRDWWFPEEYSQLLNAARQLPEPEMDALFYETTLRLIGRDPLLYLDAAIRRPLRLWRPYPHITGAQDSLSSIHQVIMLLSFVPVAVLAIIGAFRLRRLRGAEIVLVVGYLLYVTAVCTLIRGAIKYRASFEPLLIVLAGSALVHPKLVHFVSQLYQFFNSAKGATLLKRSFRSSGPP